MGWTARPGLPPRIRITIQDPSSIPEFGNCSKTLTMEGVQLNALEGFSPPSLEERVKYKLFFSATFIVALASSANVFSQARGGAGAAGAGGQRGQAPPAPPAPRAAAPSDFTGYWGSTDTPASRFR